MLVACVTRRRDLRLLREAGWYRIPLARMPQGVAAEYLAFFTGARVMGRGRGGIHGFARLRGVELCRRRDLLPDEAQRADELYYRLQLGEWQDCDPPIFNPEGRVFAFLHSTWDRFRAARRISDLSSRAAGHVPLERPLWRAPRQAGPAPAAGHARWPRRRDARPRSLAHPLLDADCVARPATLA